MLAYPDPSNKSNWLWRNEAEKFNLKLSSGYLPQKAPHVAAACNGAWYADTPSVCADDFSCKPDPSLNRYFLFCFEKKDFEPTLSHGEGIVEFQIAYSNTSGGSLTVEGYRAWSDGINLDRKILGSSDIAPLSPGQPLYFGQSTMKISATHHYQDYGAKLPLPNSPFPFLRLASTFARNGTNSYVYHQISDSIIAEELWDGTSGFWITSNITIETA